MKSGTWGIMEAIHELDTIYAVKSDAFGSPQREGRDLKKGMTWKHELLKRYRNGELIGICVECYKIKHDGSWLYYRPPIPNYQNYTGALCTECLEGARILNSAKRFGKLITG